jgi:prepilin-type N-terminal cleavage/methylation domain-containing protein
MQHRNEQGFTLVELMIVVMIVGVLAAVAIPMYQVVPERSMGTEATTALGLVKDAMRAYYAEHGSYADASFTDGALVTAGGVLGMSANDLEGRYFSEECYTFDGASGANTFTIKCDGLQSTAMCGSDVSGVMKTINQDGDIVGN